MEDHSARASTKSVEQSDIGNGNTQGHANRRFSNSYGRKPAHSAEQALRGWTDRAAHLPETGCPRCARLPTELKHINKWRRRHQNETVLVAASEDTRAGPESERSCGRAVLACQIALERADVDGEMPVGRVHQLGQ